MAEKLTLMILRRIELARTIAAGLDSFLEETVAAFDSYLSSVLAEGETPIDVRQQLVLLRRKTDFHLESLQGLDQGVLTQTSDTDFLRTEIDVLTGQATVKLRRVADLAKGVYGPEILTSLALDGEMTRVPLRVFDRGRRVQSILRGPDLKLRPVAGFVLKTEGESSLFSPLTLADELEPELTDLGLLVDTRFEDQRAQALARLRRQREVEEFDLGMRGIVRMVQGMLIAGGRPDLAKRFRLILRRAARQQGESQEGEGQPGPSQPGEGQPGPSQPGDPSTSTP
jgi:hypothetical protein